MSPLQSPSNLHMVLLPVLVVKLNGDANSSWPGKSVIILPWLWIEVHCHSVGVHINVEFVASRMCVETATAPCNTSGAFFKAFVVCHGEFVRGEVK